MYFDMYSTRLSLSVCSAVTLVVTLHSTKHGDKETAQVSSVIVKAALTETKTLSRLEIIEIETGPRL